MLLNEFLKEHREVEQLQKQVEALTVGLQKVSAQLKLRNSAPQAVVNNQLSGPVSLIGEATVQPVASIPARSNHAEPMLSRD